MGLLGIIAGSCWKWISPYPTIVKTLSLWSGSEKLETIVKDEQAYRRHLFDKYLRVTISPAKERELDSVSCKTVQGLLNGYKEKKFSCMDMVVHYSARIHELDEVEGDLLSVYLVDWALSRAEELDSLLQKTGNLSGPLHGVPILISDECELKHIPSTLGCPCRVGQKAQTTSPFIQTFIALGAIPLFKTTVSWHLLFPDPVQPISSAYREKYSPSHTPVRDIGNNNQEERHSLGGRSGSLAYLLSKANVGCLLGITTDEIGGARISADYHGLFSFKGTSKRYSLASSEKVWNGIPATACTITKSIEDLIYMQQNVLNRIMFQHDPECIPVPFNTQKYQHSRVLRIAYFSDNEVVRAFPGADRAVTTIKNILESQGHELIPIQIPLSKQIFLLLAKMAPMSHLAIRKCLPEYGMEQMTLMDAIFPFSLFLRSPQLVRTFLGGLGRLFMDDGSASDFVSQAGGSSTMFYQQTPSLSQIAADIKRYKSQFNFVLDKVFAKEPIDIILSPIHACPPLSTSSSPLIAAGSFYSSLFNILDYPCGTIPHVTKVQATDMIPNVVHYAHSDNFIFGGFGNGPVQHRTNDFRFLGVVALEESNNGIMEGKCTGKSIGVQIVGRPFEEETLLHVMNSIQERLESSQS